MGVAVRRTDDSRKARANFRAETRIGNCRRCGCRNFRRLLDIIHLVHLSAICVVWTAVRWLWSLEQHQSLQQGRAVSTPPHSPCIQAAGFDATSAVQRLASTIAIHMAPIPTPIAALGLLLHLLASSAGIATIFGSFVSRNALTPLSVLRIHAYTNC